MQLYKIMFMSVDDATDHKHSHPSSSRGISYP